jgi:hypothetical protein
MTSIGPTARQRYQDTQARAEEFFQQVLRPLALTSKSPGELQLLLSQPIPAGHPGQGHVDRLLSFTSDFEVPSRSSLGERLVYMTLVRRWAGEGAVSLDLVGTVEERFRRAPSPGR